MQLAKLSLLSGVLVAPLATAAFAATVTLPRMAIAE
jgi:hypothetical protein